jgi:hypothetical protein
MVEAHRDDAPAAFRLGRREVVVGGLLAGGLAALPALPAAAPAAPWPEESAARFMELSALLIPHRLNALIGKRIGAALQAADPALLDHVDGLLAIARKKKARIVEDFFADVPEGPLRQSALSIISAWYLGVASDAPDAEVLAYEFALMYQPTRDVMTIPSYAISGPNGWTDEAPPLSSMPQF